ncbi:MAG: hypothetical protein ACNYNY_01245 [Candidatus Oxydemutatoraceae bacterium WSBS_2016_MAG_OTU14]
MGELHRNSVADPLLEHMQVMSDNAVMAVMLKSRDEIWQQQHNCQNTRPTTDVISTLMQAAAGESTNIEL